MPVPRAVSPGLMDVDFDDLMGTGLRDRQMHAALRDNLMGAALSDAVPGFGLIPDTRGAGLSDGNGDVGIGIAQVSCYCLMWALLLYLTLIFGRAL